MDTNDKYSRKILSIQEELANIISYANELVHRNKLDTKLANRLFQTIRLSAPISEDYSALRVTIHQYIQEAKKWDIILSDILKQIDALEASRIRRERYGERWWQDKRTELNESFLFNKQEGFEKWLRTFTEALIAWRIEICDKLVDEPFPFPTQKADLQAFLQTGTHALIDEKYSEALDMLTYLTRVESEKRLQPLLDINSRAILIILAGRISLYKSKDFELALKYFQQAKELAPDDGRTYAALGDYQRVVNENQQALRFYQLAIERLPDQPDGYIGMGLLAEDQKHWDEADEWYERAISTLQEDNNYDFGLSRLLVPGGNLYLHLALKFKNDDPERALQVVNTAIKNRINKDGKYPEKIEYKLKGEILQILKRLTESAEAYYEAGTRFYWENNYQIAADLLSRANSLNLEHVPTYWYWADAIRMNSYQSDLPIEKVQEMIGQSLRIWNEGRARQMPDENYSWVYVTRALVNDRLGEFAENSVGTWESYWEAITHLEKAILLNPWESYRWAYLGRCYRTIEMESCALHATSIAIEKDNNADNFVVLEERAAILANTGKFEEADKLVDKRRSLGPGTWADGVKAYLLFQKGNLNAALDMVNKLIQTNNTYIWAYSFRAQIYRKLNDLPNALKDYDWIWNNYNDSDSLNLNYYAITAFWISCIKFKTPDISLIDKAIEIYRRYCRDSAGRSGSCNEFLGLCYLVRGDLLLAEENLVKRINLAINVRQLQEFVNVDLEDIERFSINWRHGRQVLEIIKQIKEKIKIRSVELEQPRSAFDEIQEVIAKLESQNEKETFAWIGAHAGLARLYAEKEQWIQAANTYELLIQQSDHFPEARIGLLKIIDKLQSNGEGSLKQRRASEAIGLFQLALGLERKLSSPDKLLTLQQQLGDALLQAGKSAGALIEYTEITKSVSVDHDKKELAGLHCRMGFAYFILTDRENARKYFVQSLQLFRESNHPDPGKAMSEVCMDLLQNMSHFWALQNEWTAFRDEVSSDEGLQNDLEIAVVSLQNYLDKLYLLTAKSEESLAHIPMVTPIALEISQNLIPKGSDSDWTLFNTYLPEMRTRIKDEMGVLVPGIRIRGNETGLPPDNYIILLDEIRLFSGTVQTNKRYSPASPAILQALGIPGQALTEAANPLNGEIGCWIPPEYWGIVTRNQNDLWAEPMIFAVNHLEDALRCNLADYIGVQEVEGLLENFQQQSERASALIRESLPDQEAKFRFARVLRSLVKEKVSITQLENILRTFHEAGLPGDEINKVVTSVRLKLKKYLPGNQPMSIRLEIPLEIEGKFKKWIFEKNKKRFFSIPPEETQELLTEIRGVVNSTNRNLVLVTRITELRPFVRQLVELEFPYLYVISQEELVSPEEFLHTFETDKGKENYTNE